ncbi:hypothetical protein KW782_01930 [Candidatus Parcubacteria bacterium]|nr:hypothetical protein [Candidatus Parcubacteria bacterium]
MKRILCTCILILLIAVSLFPYQNIQVYAATKAENLAKAQAALQRAQAALAAAQQEQNRAEEAFCGVKSLCPGSAINLDAAKGKVKSAQGTINTINTFITNIQNNPEGEDSDVLANAAQKNAGNTEKVLAGKGGTDPNACWDGLTPVIENCIKDLASWIAYIFLFVTAWLAGMAGLFLDEAIKFSVVTMSTKINGISIINVGWTIIRDIGNLFFIFVLLYVAITTILGLASTNTTKLIRNLILVALLVNFSLFFTKVLIDASNVVSLAFYDRFTQTQAATPPGTPPPAPGSGSVNIRSMSEQLVKDLGIVDIYNPEKAQEFLISKQWIGMLTIGIGGSIFFLFVALTFFWAGMLFFLRFVILIGLLILSPLGYFGYILPQTMGWARKWWNTLMAQLTFAPLYMLLITLVLLMAANLNKPAGAGGIGFSYDAATEGLASALGTGSKAPPPGGGGAGATESSLGPIINFVLLIAFINAATLVATSVATSSGGFAASIIGRSKNFLSSSGRLARRSAVGTAKLAGRTTGNFAANRISNSAQRLFGGKKAYNELERRRDTLTQLAKTDPSAKKELERLEKKASKEWDLRNVAGFSKVLGPARKSGGYKGRVEAQKEKNATKAGKKGETVAQESWKEVYAAQDTLKAAEAHHDREISEASLMREDTEAEKAAKEARITKAKTDLRTAQDNLGRTQRAAVTSARNAQAERAAKIVAKGGKSVKARARVKAAQEYLAVHRSAKKSQEEQIDENQDKITDTFNNFQLNPAQQEEIVAKTIKNMPHTQVAKLRPTILSDKRVAKNLSQKALETIAREKTLNEDQVEKVVEEILKDENNPAYEYVIKAKADSRDNYWYVKGKQEAAQTHREERRQIAARTEAERQTEIDAAADRVERGDRRSDEI